MTRLDTSSPIPHPGWAFRVTALHTSDTEAPWLTGTWHHGGRQPADPVCKVWIVLAAHNDGGIDVAVIADHEHLHGAFTPLARYTHLAPDTWTSHISPLIAAHPWADHIHHPTPRPNRQRAARAILAYLMTSR